MLHAVVVPYPLKGEYGYLRVHVLPLDGTVLLIAKAPAQGGSRMGSQIGPQTQSLGLWRGAAYRADLPAPRAFARARVLTV